MADDPASTSDADAPSPEPTSAPGRWGRRLFRVVGGVVAGLALLVGALLLGLQTDTGATRAARWLARFGNPLPGTHLAVEQASGNWVRSLRLTGVSLTRTDSSGTTLTMASVDTLTLRYRLWPLLQGRLRVTDVSVAGPEVTMRQAADSTWDWLRLWPEPSPAPDTSAGMPIRIDRVRVARGAFSAAFYAEGRDSTARVRNVHVHARNITSASAVTGRLDSLGLRAQLPDTPTDIRLAARGTLTATGLSVDSLHLRSPRSRVYGHGRLPLSQTEDDAAGDAQFRLRADPLALRDLTPLAPTLDVDPAETVRLDVRAAGTGERLTATVDGRFSGGGTIAAQATMTPTTTTTPEGPPLLYRLDAEVRNLTTSLLGLPDTTRNRLNATLSADLTGPALSALDGTADLRLRNSRWAGLRTPSLRLASTFRDGTATLDLEGLLNDARLQVTGTTRPLDDAPDASLTARVRDVDVSSFAPDAGIESALSATTTIEARALGTAEQALDVTLALAPSRVGAQRIRDGQVSLALRPDRARLEGRLALPTGAVQARGSADLDGREQFALERLRLDRVDLAALAGDTTGSRVTGTARITGRGFAPETMTLDASIALHDSHYGRYRLDTLQTQAALENGRLTATTTATLNGGHWTLGLNGRPFASTPSFELARGRFDDVDIGPLLADTTQSSALSGTVQGSVRGLAPETLTAEAQLRLDSSRVNRQRIDDARLSLRLANAVLDTELRLDTPEGGTQLIATARPFDAPPTVRITDGSFENLDLGALAGLSGPSTALSGSVTLDGRGATASDLVLDADVSFSNSRVNDAVLSSGSVSVSAERGRARIDGQLAVAGGQIGLQAQVDSLEATPTYAVRTSVDSLDAAALAGADSLTARIGSAQWTLDGRGLDPNTLTSSTQLSASDVHIDAFSLTRAALEGTYRRGRLILDTLTAQSNALTGTGSGTLAVTDTAATSDFSLRADITNARPLRRLLGAETLQLKGGSVEAQIYGSSLATQRFDGEAELAGLLYDELRLAEAEVNFNGQRGRDQLLRRLELSGSLGYLSLPSVSAERTQLNAIYDGTATDLSANVRLDPTHSAAVDARVRTDSVQTTVTLRQLNLRFEGDRWSLLQEATLVAGRDYQIRGLLLHSGPQQIAVDGVVDPQGTQNLVATVENVRLGAVSSLGGLEGLDGRLSGALTLSGPAPSPRLDSQLSLDLRSEDRPVGTLRLDADYHDLALTLDADLAHTDGSTLTAEGSIPMDLRLRAPVPEDVTTRPVRLDLSTRRFPVNWVDPFLDPETIRDVQGTLAADVEVRGTLDDPDLDGTASLSNGGASLPALETRYSGAAATLRFAEDQLRLDEAVLRSSNDGRLRATGVINFPQLTVGEYDLSLEASDFIAIDTRAYRRTVIDGATTLRGTTQRPVLNGRIQVQSANIYYNEALAEAGAAVTTVPLSEEDRLTLENRFGLRLSSADTTTFDTYEALEMNLTVNIQRDTWLRSKSNPELNVQFTGDLDVSKAPYEEPQVFGSIEVAEERSTLRQFGQEFQITEGTLTFNGDPYTPYLVLEAVYEQRARGAQGTEVRITLRLEGRPDTLTPTLSSEPPMDTRNILSYLATGRPADQLLSGGEGGGNLATQVALGQATNFVENLAASELGLDVVRLQLRTSGASYLTVGRYFTPRFFVSIEQPVATSNVGSFQSTQYLPDLTLEYQLLDTLMLRARNNQQSFQLNLLFEYAY